MNNINTIRISLYDSFKIEFNLKYYIIHLLRGSALFVLLILNSPFELRTIIFLVVTLLLYPFSKYIINCLMNVVVYGYEIFGGECDMITIVLSLFYSTLRYLLTFVLCLFIIPIGLPIILYISKKIILN